MIPKLMGFIYYSLLYVWTLIGNLNALAYSRTQTVA